LPVETEAQQAAWKKLSEHLERWFYKPDLQALEAVLTAAFAHRYVQADCLWLFVVGPSRSGKTAVCINACSSLQHSYVLSKLTPKTFLSGYQNARNKDGSTRDASLLQRLGPTPLLLFKDFTSVLSMRDDDRLQIASDLREIADGLLSKPTGMGQDLVWRGKATVIAVCTPALDRAWGVQRDLGERFLTVRWPRRDGATASLAARAQRGHEKEITEGTRRLAKAFVEGTTMEQLPELSTEQGNRLDHLSEVVAVARGKVYREGGKRIVEMPNIEDTPGIAKGLDGFARYHAALFGRTSVDQRDISLMFRVAHDSIPPVRQAILTAIPDDGKTNLKDLGTHTGMTARVLEYALDDLTHLGAITVERNPVGFPNDYAFSPKFAEMRKVAYATP